MPKVAAKNSILHANTEPASLHRYYYVICLPRECKKAERQKVVAWKDNNDVTADTVIINTAISRQQWADKIYSSSRRGISWIIVTGLSIQHTPLFLARTQEICMVKLWGLDPSHWEELPKKRSWRRTAKVMAVNQVTLLLCNAYISP